MRASMSVPAAFAPVEIDGRLLVDGGLVDNLPVDVVRGMGADIVITVNIGTPLLPREERLDSRHWHADAEHPHLQRCARFDCVAEGGRC